MAVHLDGRLIGTATQRNGTATFVYDFDYLASHNPTPLSLAMPLGDRKYGNKVVSAWLEGLLPDSQVVRERLARQHSASANNPFSLLRHVGRDAAGAVQILPRGDEAPDAAERAGAVEWLSDGDFDTILRELAEHGADWDPGVYQGRWSLAGAQAKIALHGREVTRADGKNAYQWGIPRDSTPTTHIIKPSIKGFDNHHINEALCMLTAAYADLPAARTELIDRDNIQAVISHRYDRRRLSDGRWVRLHQEDMCQALSVHPSAKYQSDGGPGVGQIADLLRRLSPRDHQASAQRFLRFLAFNVMIGGTDAHAKNYSVLLSGSRATLAPMYDVASAASYPHHERLDSPMKIGDASKFLDVTDKDWAKVGKRLGLDPEEAVTTVAEVRAAIPQAMHDAIAALPESARAEAQRQGERIIDHVQRRWKPDLERDPKLIRGPRHSTSWTGRGTTTPKSNTGSFHVS